MEKKFYTTIIEAMKNKKYSFIISPGMLIAERKNAIENNYEILEVVGKGAFAEVKKVRHRELNYIRALKIIKKSKFKSP
jgi:serine/threonine protein kinase